jgi:WD40 repeat protein
LAQRKLLVVTGPNLDIYTEQAKTRRWIAEELIAEPRRKPGETHPRPYISDVTFLDGKIHTCGLSVFGGPVVVFDIEAKTPVRTYLEHEKRVWQIANIRPEVFASCSDDHTIKIWDARVAQSVSTLTDHIGRVSCLLRLNDTQLVSGSCPDDLNKATERARLEFWDMRTL